MRAGFAKRDREALLRRVDDLDEEPLQPVARESIAVEEHARAAEGLAERLGHPLVDREEVRIEQLRLESGRSRALPQAGLEGGASDALGKRRAQQDHPARPDDRRRRRDSLDRLVERRVERGSSGRREHDVGRLGEARRRLLRNEIDRSAVRGFEVSAEQACDASLAAEGDVHREVDARASCGLHERLVERIAVDEARSDAALEHRRAVSETDRPGRSEPGADRLAPAGISGHEVRLDEAGHDPEIAFEKEAIDLDRKSAARASEGDVRGRVSCVVLNDAKRPRKLGPEDPLDLFGRGRSMQARRDLDRDGFAGESAGLERVEDRGKEGRVRNRSRGVAHDDDGIAPSSRELRERRTRDGRGERLAELRTRIGERRNGGLAKHVDTSRPRLGRIGNLDRERSQPVREGDLHARSIVRTDRDANLFEGERGNVPTGEREGMRTTRLVVLWAAALASVAAAEGREDRFDTVVVDAGHGGDDHGAQGPDGLLEKTLVLEVAQSVAAKLRERGVRVVLTRESDRAVALQERTRIANDASGDLFVSIHANAAPSPAAAGTETFFLSLEASDERARSVAARENEAFTSGVSAATAPDDPVTAILGDLAHTEHLIESDEFARLALERLDAADPAPSRGVKQAPFVVLMGVRMPAALVEIGFLTNPDEAGRLAAPERREEIAAALAAAVEEFGRRYDARRGVDRASGAASRDAGGG